MLDATLICRDFLSKLSRLCPGGKASASSFNCRASIASRTFSEDFGLNRRRFIERSPSVNLTHR